MNFLYKLITEFLWKFSNNNSIKFILDKHFNTFADLFKWLFYMEVFADKVNKEKAIPWRELPFCQDKTLSDFIKSGLILGGIFGFDACFFQDLLINCFGSQFI